MVMKLRDKEEFEQRYQFICDTIYWSEGQCCAGCDYWQSDAGKVGYCTKGPKVSSEDSLAGIGIFNCSLPPATSHVLTKSNEWCGEFKDDFNWSDLDSDYLDSIGAMICGRVMEKPNHRANESRK